MHIRTSFFAILFSLSALGLTACGSNIIYETGPVENSEVLTSSPDEKTGIKTISEEPGPEDGSVSSDETIFVHVCGAVKNAGVYEMDADARIFEAIDAAGGLNEDAAADSINQALKLNDGDRIYVPTSDEVAKGETGQAGGIAADPADDRININTADESELMSLPGIGESKAKAIVAYRQEHGTFTETEDITAVSGIGKATFEKFKDRIKVNE